MKRYNFPVLVRTRPEESVKLEILNGGGEVGKRKIFHEWTLRKNVTLILMRQRRKGYLAGKKLNWTLS